MNESFQAPLQLTKKNEKCPLDFIVDLVSMNEITRGCCGGGGGVLSNFKSSLYLLDEC